jgi:hypothetical protein
MQIDLLVLATIYGLLIAYVDFRPTWDDTGITLLALLVIIGLFNKKRPWLFALAIGVWIPLWGILTTHDIRFFLSLVLPFIGVYAGWTVHRAFRNNEHPAKF